MATRIVSRADGTVISRNGKREENDEEKVNNRLAQAAYTAVTPAQPIVSGVTGAGNAGYTIAAGSTVGRPTNFAGGDAAYLNYLQNEPAIKAANLAYNTGSNGRIAQAQNGVDIGSRYAPKNQGSLSGTPYGPAYNASVNANEAAVNAAVAAIEGQAPGINRQYEDLAKQAYASYVKGGAVLPYQTQSLATGSQDNLALQQQLGYENTRAGISQNKADALLALESQVAQARSTGAANLAELESQYATLQAQFLQEAQQAAYAQQQAQQEAAYAQDLAMAKANAPKTAGTVKSSAKVPSYSEMKYYDELYKNGSLPEDVYQQLRAAYFGSFNLTNQQTPTPKVTPNIPQSGYEAAPDNPKLQAAINQSTQTGDITPLVQYYISLGLYSDDEIAEIVNRMLGQ
jgi:hypothetical protein